MSKKLTPDFATVRKLTEKYSVQIEITFGERFRTIVLSLSNRTIKKFPFIET